MTWVNMMDIVYPVSSLYMSSSSMSPANKFGGTWTAITGAVLRANNAWGYNGSDNHTLTINEMPTHRHEWKGYTLSRLATNNSSPEYLYALFGTDPVSSSGGLQSAGGGHPSQNYPDISISTVGIEQPKGEMTYGMG